MTSIEAAPMQPQTKLMKTHPLARKLNKILNTSLEDAQTQEALETLSEFYTENTLASRRNLLGDIERRATVINRTFLESFEGVNKHLVTIEKEIFATKGCCDDIEEKLQSAKEQTSHLLKQTQELKMRSARCKVRKTIADAFLARFTLSDEEVQVLTSASPVGASFFEALKHLHQINEDCKALLITEHQRAGLEIMESMAIYQETAYEKLFRWAQTECRSMNRDSPEVTQAMKDAMRALKRRPVLFQTIIDEISHTRRSALVRSFIDALTRGGPGGYPRPIEIHAHDSLRYVGDILAWLHQSAASEREMLEGLFDVSQEAKRKLPPLDRKPTIPEDMDEMAIEDFVPEEEAIVQILDRNLEGTCRPLRVRIEQVVSSQPGAITAYRIANLIQFYGSTIAKVMGPSAQLSLTVEEATASAFKAFMDTLNTQASELLRFVQTPTHDLTPPPAVKDTVLQLKEIMASYDSSLLSSEEPDRDFSEILTAMLDPLLQMCVLGAASLSTLENAVYMVNCLHFIQTAVSSYSFTSGHVELIESQVEGQIEILVQEQYKDTLLQSGLAPVVEAIEDREGDAPLSTLPQLDGRSIANAMSKLDTFLCSVSMEISPTLAKITSSRLAGSITQRASKMLVETYKSVYEQIVDPANGYENPATLAPRTVMEVETLLSIHDEEY